jgi:hypothetical protein
MKTTRLERTHKLVNNPGARGGRGAFTAGIAVAYLTLAVCAGRAEILDDFSDPAASATKWNPGCFWGVCGHVVTNGQARVSVTPDGDHGFAGLTSRRLWTLQEGRTLEFRVDLISSSGDGAVARLVFGVGNPDKYVLNVDEDTIVLLKREDPLQVFFLTNGPSIKVANVKLVLSMTGGPRSSVLIQWKILDNDQAGLVLYAGSQWDTAQAEPMAVGSDSPPESFIGRTGRINLSVYHDNAKAFDPDVSIPRLGEAAVVFDNAQVLEYDSPCLNIDRATNGVALTWHTPIEEHITVEANGLAGPWSPCPTLHSLGIDTNTMCLTTPCLGQHNYFKLVPGRQFTDDFSGAKPLWTNSWQTTNEIMAVTNGIMRIARVGPQGGGILPRPPEDVVASDFYSSVDILSWTTSGANWCYFSIVARGRSTGPNSGNGYIGGLVLNYEDVPGNVVLSIWDGSVDVRGPSFDIGVIPPPYRLEFSGVGQSLRLRVLNLTSKEVIGEQTLARTTFTEGWIGFWVNSPPNNPETHELTVDNFFVTGTKP